MRKLLPLALVVVSGSASAQPGADGEPPPYPTPPPPQPYAQPQPPPYQPPPPQGYAPPPQTYMPVQLTPDEHELLQRGEIGDGAHVGGAIASLFFGFGIGQAVQGRYGDTGWIFTIGELASITALIVGVTQSVEDCFGVDSSCNDDRGEGLIIGGLVGLVAFRVWELVDAFGGPSKHNRKVRELRMRLGMPMPMYTQRVVPYVNRTNDGGGTAGVVFRF
jgi:hypothetical protein